MQVQTFAVAQSPTTSCAATAVKAPVVREVVKLDRVNLRSLIERQAGKFISATFVKQDGETRILTGRLGVTFGLKGGTNTVEASDRPYITVFDIQLREYRVINLATCSLLRACGKEFVIAN